MNVEVKSKQTPNYSEHKFDLLWSLSLYLGVHFSLQNMNHLIFEVFIVFLGSSVAVRELPITPYPTSNLSCIDTKYLQDVDGYPCEWYEESDDTECTIYGASFCCTHSTIEANSIEDCAANCRKMYSLDESFVDINYYPDWLTCNCILDDTGETGQIISTISDNIWSCYASNQFQGGSPWLVQTVHTKDQFVHVMLSQASHGIYISLALDEIIYRPDESKFLGRTSALTKRVSLK